MGLVEAVLVGLQFKRLEKPIVFISMFIGFIFFTILGLVIVAAGVEMFLAGKGLIASVGLSLMSVFFFCLSAACGYFIKRSVN
jgi:hypothetical protein